MMRAVGLLRMWPALLLLTSCNRTARFEATASWRSTSDGVVISVRVPHGLAAPLTAPGKQFYFGLGRCADGENGMRYEGRSDQPVLSNNGVATLQSWPFDDVRQLSQGMCTQLKSASMSPFSVHYRTGLLRLT